MDPAAGLGRPGPASRDVERLRTGRLEVRGRLLAASNASFVCELRASNKGAPQEHAGDSVHSAPLEAGPGLTCVYKPIRGERPLFDFPIGTLAYREVAAYTLSAVSGWDVVPPTVLRDGPFGPGAVQLWIDLDETADPLGLIRARQPALRRMALFDAIVNNADRKVGHLLPVPGGHVYGVEHGICFAAEPKLRTVLWGWRGEPVPPEDLAVVARLAADLEAGLGEALCGLLAPREVEATRRRASQLLQAGRFPQPDPDRPAVPWPPF
jgi:hypothetical protein